MNKPRSIWVMVLLVISSVFVLGESGCPAPDNTGGTTELTLEVLGEGSVTLSPPGTVCDQNNSPVSGIYDSGAIVTLTATPDDGWVFYGWTGDLSGDDNPATLTMDDDKDVTAIFMSEDVATLLDEVEPPDDSEPLPQGTWSGYVAIDYQMGAEASGECRSDDDDSTFTYEHEENESKQAAVTVGPYQDIFVTTPREIDGKLVVSMDNSYHNVTQHDSEECCQDPPCAEVVSPGDTLDFLTTRTGGDTITFDQEIMGVSTEVVINIMPEGMGDGDIDGWDMIQETLTWIRPYEDARIPVEISVEISPADNKEVPFTETSTDIVTDACQGTQDSDTTSSEAGTIDISMSYTVEGVLIKRSNGHHEIVGMYENSWTEDSSLFPCGSHYPEEYMDHCTVHLVRTP